MINSNELRKGNYVFINNPKSWSELQNIPMQVSGLGENSTEFDGVKDTVTVKKAINDKYDIYYDYNQFAQFIEPIEITEKWLIDLGFTLVRESNYGKFYDFENDVHCFKIKVLSKEIRATYENTFLRTVKYVHELQNLVFIISGIELTLKSEQ